MGKGGKTGKSLAEYRASEKTWRLKKQAERAALGLCTRCGQPAVPGRKLCDKCNSRGQQYRQESYEVKLQQAIDYLGGKCQDCGRAYPPIVYDFYHADPDNKEFTITGNRFFLPWDELKAELDKCALLCSNCRRIRQGKK